MTASAANSATLPPVATLVPDDRRPDFLPRLFGWRHLLLAEYSTYRFMERLSPDYGGGMWDFLEHGAAPLYLRPASDSRFRIACETSYEGEVSADAAGIIATLFAFSHLSFGADSDRMSEGYSRLYAFAGDHPEANAIFGTID